MKCYERLALEENRRLMEIDQELSQAVSKAFLDLDDLNMCTTCKVYMLLSGLSVMLQNAEEEGNIIVADDMPEEIPAALSIMLAAFTHAIGVVFDAKFPYLPLNVGEKRKVMMKQGEPSSFKNMLDNLIKKRHN